MEGRGVKIFAMTFLVATAALFGAWLVVDSLAHLDEFLAGSGPGVSPADVAARYYAGVVRLHGGTMLGAVAVTAAASGIVRARRDSGRRRGTLA